MGKLTSYPSWAFLQLCVGMWQESNLSAFMKFYSNFLFLFFFFKLFEITIWKKKIVKVDSKLHCKICTLYISHLYVNLSSYTVTDNIWLSSLFQICILFFFFYKEWSVKVTPSGKRGDIAFPGKHWTLSGGIMPDRRQGHSSKLGIHKGSVN